MQKLAKHAEPAAAELSDNMESGAHKFAKHAGPATKEFADKAIDMAHDVAKNAGPQAHKVCPTMDLSRLDVSQNTYDDIRYRSLRGIECVPMVALGFIKQFSALAYPAEPLNISS